MDNCQKSYRLFSPAKVNLGLRITGRRPDGYHLLESLFWPISLGDEIELISSEKSHKVELVWEGSSAPPSLPEEKQNLVYRLLHCLFPEDRRESPKWKVIIRKKTPIGGGLGGGSSNTGTLMRFFSDKYPALSEQISQLAPLLGADVPFFLKGEAAWVTGIGENIRPLLLTPEIEGLEFVLIVPPFSCPTAQVFQAYARSAFPYSLPTPFPDPFSYKDLLNFLANTGNDLEQAACSQFPLLTDILSCLRGTNPLYAGLSGTGSTCFAVYHSQREKEKIIKVLQQFCRSNHCENLAAATYRATS